MLATADLFAKHFLNATYVRMCIIRTQTLKYRIVGNFRRVKLSLISWSKREHEIFTREMFAHAQVLCAGAGNREYFTHEYV